MCDFSQNIYKTLYSMMIRVFYDFVIIDEINIYLCRHKLVRDQMTTKKVVKVVSFGLSPIGEKYPQTLSKPNATQLNTTLKQLALELDIVVMCSTPPTHKLLSHF